ncbi:MAG: sugar ABC transporter permease [Clostridia bacterium]|nr:sugar ABC transporter permease [Clostridia bacterium]
MTNSQKQKNKSLQWLKNVPYFLMQVPGLLWLVLFHFVPIFGLVIAFKDYKYANGIFGSAWNGLDNFKTFFSANYAFRIFRNTIGYNLIWMLLVNLFLGMLIAIMLYEVRNKIANKIYQTSMLIPYFVSYVIIAYIGFLFLSHDNGLLNQLIKSFGGKEIYWYYEPKVWPYILTFFDAWKNIGMASLYYYAALLAIDPCLFESASLDGAGRLRQIWYISVPELMPMASVVLISKVGGVLGGGMDIFYQLPMNSSKVYETTETIATYLFRGLASGSISTSAAVGFFQSVIGVILLLITNRIIRKISPENAMF